VEPVHHFLKGIILETMLQSLAPIWQREIESRLFVLGFFIRVILDKVFVPNIKSVTNILIARTAAKFLLPHGHCEIFRQHTVQLIVYKMIFEQFIFHLAWEEFG
jgi:hypothetical protein